ncbi:hypothetical protein EVU96_25205 [Bacillus infantis]|uniref:hypothetical protein n=1 Tax=Bacillus infantis TaxID=324767 RepID=UPI00101C5AD0|nr:hypothetical protein [Bacillus infantis]RYI24986.1 hypothetical protein EVU96_25205 [Bacillus infantis]
MRVQTVGTISQFMAREHSIKDQVKRLNKEAKKYGIKAKLTSVAGGLAVALTPVSAFAQTPAEFVKGKAQEQIMNAFMPLVDLIQALSYPVAAIMLTAGALMFMINQKDKGIGLIQNASIGYILVQLMPLFLKILVGLGSTVGLAVLI